MMFSVFGFSQDYWSKTYDPFEHEHDDIRNILIEDSIIYASSRGSCLKDSVVECAKMVKFNLDGEYLNGYENPLFETGYGLESDEHWLYVDGGNKPFYDKLFVNRISKDFVEEVLKGIDIDSNFILVNRSSIVFDNYFIMYGAYRDISSIDENGNNIVNGVQAWVNKETFEVDTIIHLLPTRWYREIESMVFDDRHHAYSIGSDSQLNENGVEVTYLRITKQNRFGGIVYEFTYPISLGALSSYSSSITLVDNRLVFRAAVDDPYSDPNIVCVDTLGNKLWEYKYKELRKITPSKILKGNNDQVYVLGLTKSVRFGWGEVPFISCLDGRTGKLLWERVYEVDKGQDPIFEEYAKFSRFFDLVQLNNGDIYVAGYVRNIYNDPVIGVRHDKDLWLMKIDSMGCLTPNCGYVQSIQNGEVVPDTCKWLEDGAKWFYTPWAIDFQDRLAKIDIIRDTLIGNRLCSVLGLFENDEFIENSDLIVFYERENEKVYFNENDSFKLMYDFSLSVLPGDTVEFYLPQKHMYYDISSSGGDFLPNNNPYKYRNIGQEWVTTQDGEQLRIVNTQPIPNEDGECFVLGRIIDGVGSELGITGKSCNQLPSGRDEFFRCFNSTALEYSEVNGECLITSTQDIISSDRVSIFPNPASKTIQIESDIPFVEIKMYDLSGKCVKMDTYKNTIDIDFLINGLYFLELIGEEGIYQTKIIKGN